MGGKKNELKQTVLQMKDYCVESVNIILDTGKFRGVHGPLLKHCTLPEGRGIERTSLCYKLEVAKSSLCTHC